jgi:hypothetical protein
VKRLLIYRPAAQRELNRMDSSDAERIMRAWKDWLQPVLETLKL